MAGLEGENVYDFPDHTAHLANEQYVIVPMVGGTYSPVYIGTDEQDVDEVCAALNEAVHNQWHGGMFVVECVTTFKGNLNWSMHRDADRMCWVDSRHGDV